MNVRGIISLRVTLRVTNVAVVDLYSKRLAKQNQSADVFTYDVIPRRLRVQVIQIAEEVIGEGRIQGQRINVWDVILVILKREYGEFELSNGFDEKDELKRFLLSCTTLEALDTIELMFRAIETICSQAFFERRSNAKSVAQEAIDEINTRFKESALGYEYSNGQIIRIDSLYIHSQAVLPALEILRLDDQYSGAESEFLKAHEFYRHGDASSVLVECCKAFESIMKAICTKRGWAFDSSKDTASKLVEICFKNNLIPAYWQTHFGGLRSVLESALPTPRNKSGGHGVGTTPIAVPIELARYVLHMTASTLLFLAEADARLP